MVYFFFLFQTCEHFLSLCIKDVLPPESILFEIYGKITQNQSSLWSRNLKLIGQGLWIEYSTFKHSCKHNATWYFDGRYQIVRTLEDVNSFDDIRFAYFMNGPDTTETRRKEIKRCYFYECDCERCQDVEADKLKSSISCTNCSGIMHIFFLQDVEK